MKPASVNLGAASPFPIVRITSLTAVDSLVRMDPYPRLALLREACPVHHDVEGGAYLVTRMQGVRAVLTDNTCLKDPDRAEPSALAIRRRRATVPDGLAFPDDQRASMLELDGEEHARVRQPLVKALYARIAAFEPQCMHIIDSCLDRLEGRLRLSGENRFDLMAEIAETVPVACIGAMLGVHADEYPQFRKWLDGIVQTFNPARTPGQVAALVESSNGLAAYIRRRFEAAKAKPGDDLFGDMARAQAAGVPLTDTEITYNLRGLLIAGNVTTTDLIGNAVRLVLPYNDQRDRLMNNPQLWNTAVEEALRIEPPVDSTWRIAARPLDISGCPLHPGAAMNVFIRSANRDDKAFPKADRFDVTRPNASRHVAFGGGAHICPGAPLARMEARLPLPRLFERFPGLQLDDPVAPPQWRSLPGFRGLESLVVRTR